MGGIRDRGHLLYKHQASVLFFYHSTLFFSLLIKREVLTNHSGNLEAVKRERCSINLESGRCGAEVRPFTQNGAHKKQQSDLFWLSWARRT